MAATIEEDVSLDDDDIEEGDDDGGESYVLPDFMPAARDIMRRFPRRPEAAGAATDDRGSRLPRDLRHPSPQRGEGVIPPRPGGTPAARRTPKASALGAALSKSVPVAGPGLCGRRCVRRSRRPEDPPEVGLGLHRGHRHRRARRGRREYF